MPVELSDMMQQGLTLSAGAGALVAISLYLRRIFKNMGLEDAQLTSAEKAVNANVAVLDNLQGEVTRLVKRVAILEEQLTHIQDKLAGVRLLALECYELALACECDDQTRSELLSVLRQIIKEA